MELRPAPSCGVMMRVVRYEDAQALARALCDALANALARPAAVMLAGGTTPLAAYRLLAERRPPIHPDAVIFFSDDRHVPPDDLNSNFGNIAPCLRAAGLAEHQMLRVFGEQPLEVAESLYDKDLRALFERFPKASLGLLGLGADGHTASLFSAKHIAQAEGRWAIAVQRPDGLGGISATPAVFRQIDRILVAISGGEKREIARRLVREPRSIPAGLALAGHHGVELWCDSAAWPFDT